MIIVSLFTGSCRVPRRTIQDAAPTRLGLEPFRLAHHRPPARVHGPPVWGPGPHALRHRGRDQARQGGVQAAQQVHHQGRAARPGVWRREPGQRERRGAWRHGRADKRAHRREQGPERGRRRHGRRRTWVFYFMFSFPFFFFFTFFNSYYFFVFLVSSLLPLSSKTFIMNNTCNYEKLQRKTLLVRTCRTHLCRQHFHTAGQRVKSKEYLDIQWNLCITYLYTTFTST